VKDSGYSFPSGVEAKNAGTKVATNAGILSSVDVLIYYSPGNEAPSATNYGTISMPAGKIGGDAST
jgi:hypothetical protein